MKTIILLSACLFALACNACNRFPASLSSKELEAGFVSTPDSIQTSIYWYWISDHISEEGVVKDLQSMKRIGINRAFIGNIGLDERESGVGRVKFNSEEWWRIVHTALKTASELGIEIGIFNSPGWSQSGGPWVKPTQAMRYLATTSTTVMGGRLLTVTLPRPQGDFEDVKVVAFPAVMGANSVLNTQNATLSTHPAIAGAGLLIDGDHQTAVTLVPSEGKNKEVVISVTASEPFTLRSIRLYATEAAIDTPAKIEVEEQGVYRTLAEFPVSRFNASLNVGFDPYAPVVISVPATTARTFRLVLSHPSAGAGLREVEFSSVPFVERYPEKTLAKMYQTPLPYWHEYMWRKQPVEADSTGIVVPSQVLDLTDRLQGDCLTWEAPAGEWTVLRTGMLPTGVTNGPTHPEARGLEIDKMSKKHVAAHFEAYLGEIYRRIPAEDRTCWKVVVQDSYETGGQNFTDGFLADFQARYGYDPVPFLPVYAGVVVGSEAISDRFLWDVRRMVADKVAYDYVAGLREVSHTYGLTTWLENYGHWGFPGEFLQYGGQSDEIGGEFWSEGSLGDIENRAASSCGHIYGKNKISAESFTAGGGGFHRYPAMMKQRGDRFFTEGINNTLLHVYISQPYEDREPGVNAPFGNEFNRKNTLFPQLDLFIHYLKRVNFMLQQGLNVADVAYFIGEDAPKMTGVADPALPKGYQFDYINAEVIERDLIVRKGRLTLPHGTQYRLLVLPRQETMRPELLEKIAQLIRDGAVVLGTAPVCSPSYENYPTADQRVRTLANDLWSQIDPTTHYARIGKGLLIDGLDLAAAMALIECVPDFKTEQTDPLLYGHRAVDGMEIYFVSNQSDKTIEACPEFRVVGQQPEAWNAIDGTIRPLPAYTPTATGVKVPLKLEGYESVFVVFRHKADVPINSSLAANYPPYRVVQTLEGPWTLTFSGQKRGPASPLVVDRLFDLSQSKEFDIRHYSGPVNYRKTFVLTNKPDAERIYLNLNDVTAMAKINVNGMDVGGVWTAPYRVEITKAVVQGENTIEIEVVTTWKNRLIGDLNLPEGERKTWVAFQPWSATEGLQKSGLVGPVTIEQVKF
ncbi:MAG: glycosyl hydrolase [Alistipes sp.]